MRVICINDVGKDGIKLQIVEGEIYTATPSDRKGYYKIKEHDTYLGANVCYEQERFIPLSDINEIELVSQRLKHLITS